MRKIETVRDLIAELQTCNQDAIVCGGDNFGNRFTIGFGGADGCTRENCEYVCLDIIGRENCEREN